ncbi:hypothetical protein IJ732_04255 [bacterium]|nr:hypothetical protein [bacterium]
MTEKYFYTTHENDRFDKIAQMFFGNCYKISPIIEENTHVKIREVLQDGIELTILKQETETKTENAQTPTWKRSE